MPKSTVAAIITRIEHGVEEVLLAKRNTEPYLDCWCLPGGHVEPGETAENAVVREIKEEVGLEFTQRLQFLFDEDIPEKKIRAEVSVFAGTATGAMKTQESEIAEAKWFATHEAVSMDLAFQHRDVLRRYLEPAVPDKSREEMLAEYATLREEICRRMEMRQRILVFTLVAAGALMTYGLKMNDALVLLLYPLLAMPLALVWSQIDVRTGEIGDYIRTCLEVKLPGLNWETYIRGKKTTIDSVHAKIGTELAAQGIFSITQVLALAYAIKMRLPQSTFRPDFSTLEWVLVAVDVAVLVVTACLIRRRRRGLA